MNEQYAPTLMQVGDKVKFSTEKQSYRVKALSGRYAIVTKPFNPQKTVLYSIIDFKEKIRGPEDLVFGMGAETDQQCWEMLVRILDGESGISRRHHANLYIEWIKNGVDGGFVYSHETGEVTVEDILNESKS